MAQNTINISLTRVGHSWFRTTGDQALVVFSNPGIKGLAIVATVPGEEKKTSQIKYSSHKKFIVSAR